MEEQNQSMNMEQFTPPSEPVTPPDTRYKVYVPRYKAINKIGMAYALCVVFAVIFIFLGEYFNATGLGDFSYFEEMVSSLQQGTGVWEVLTILLALVGMIMALVEAKFNMKNLEDIDGYSLRKYNKLKGDAEKTIGKKMKFSFWFDSASEEWLIMALVFFITTIIFFHHPDGATGVPLTYFSFLSGVSGMIVMPCIPLLGAIGLGTAKAIIKLNIQSSIYKEVKSSLA